MLTRRPTLEPLDLGDQLAARRALAVGIVESRWRATDWTAAERLADDILDRLRGDGLELVKVRRP